jgi:hemolysin type calcium-binding protein
MGNATSTLTGRVVTRTVFAILLGTLCALLGAQSALATHGEAHATIKQWEIGSDPVIGGFDPHETIDDMTGLTDQVGNPTIVTIMENGQFGFCGMLFWNPDTNVFKVFGVGGGLNVFGDVDRSAPGSHGTINGMTFGGGDTWSIINGGSAFTYVNFRGTTNFREWNIASNGTGLRVNPTTGLVYFGNFVNPGEFYELNPQTNGVRRFTTGNRPYQFALDSSGNVYMTAVGTATVPDQILRFNPSTNVLRRWNVPGTPTGNFQDNFSLGTPNGIAIDPEGSVWFTESASDQIGRLNPSTNVIDEFAKAGVDDPQSIASSGTGATLQAFFTEGGDAGVLDPGHISLLTHAQATPTSTTVAPVDETLTPVASTATPTDFSKAPATNTIAPTTFDSPGVDPSGILRFPIAPTTDKPTGMTRVARPRTVFGSMEGSHHVFELTSSAIVADSGETPPVGTGSCQGKVATISGTEASEDIVGTAGPDVIRAGGGNDTVEGLGGNDTICGNPGDDVLHGNNGQDSIRGNKNKDQVGGDAGNDRLHGDSSDDRVEGGKGDDFLQGGSAFDRCFGGPGKNTARSCQVIRQAKRVRGK